MRHLQVFKLLIFISVFCCSDSVFSAERIGNIIIEGNVKTNQRVIVQEMVIKQGDLVDVERIMKSVQYVMDLNLFEKVSYRLEKRSSSELVDVIITVKERYYLIILPSAKTDENNHVDYGLRTRWDNVFGLNHRLSWKLIDTGSSFGVDEFRNEIDYIMPRIFFSTYQLTILFHENVVVNEDLTAGSQEQENHRIGLDVLKWLKKKGTSSGYFVGGGIEDRERISEAIFPTGISKGVFEAFVYKFRFGYEDVHEYRYNRDGFLVQYLLDAASDDFGSGGGSGFVKHQLDYRRYHSLDKTTGRNVNVRVRIGSSAGEELGEPAFSLGGNVSLRGYELGQFKGNAMISANIEYLSMLYEDPQLRKLFFLDFGDTYPELTDIKISEFKVGVGAGIRWKVRNFVNINVRLDVAYGVETDEVRVSFGARHTF